MLLLTLSILLACGVLFSLNQKRSKTLEDFPLTTNCLLTKCPIVFLEGQPSLFYFNKYWNNLPSYLREHGYDVFILSYPGKNTKKRRQALLASLKESAKKHGPFHLVTDPSLTEDCEWIQDKENHLIASITTLVVHKETCAPVKTEDLRPNNRYHIVCNEPPAKHGLQQKLWRTLLMAHKLYTKKPKTWSHSILNLPSFNNQEYRKTLLSHMIFLAESDIQCSH